MIPLFGLAAFAALVFGALVLASAPAVTQQIAGLLALLIGAVCAGVVAILLEIGKERDQLGQISRQIDGSEEAAAKRMAALAPVIAAFERMNRKAEGG